MHFAEKEPHRINPSDNNDTVEEFIANKQNLTESISRSGMEVIFIVNYYIDNKQCDDLCYGGNASNSSNRKMI